jgi:DNA-binding SARP family transcriptional activator
VTTLSPAVSAGVVTVPRKTRCPRPSGLTRTRLEAALLSPGEPGQALVVAPPGAGKTTLLSQVAAAFRGPVAWYGAGPQDTDEAQLVRYLGQALLQDSGVGQGRADRLDALLVALGDDEDAGSRLLVVDDLHEIAASPAEEALARFLTLRPRSVRVLLGARRPPTFNTPRMLASGEMVQVSGDDLRFRSWEVEDLFRDVYQEPLAPEAAALLCRRVGGLAAALQLFHLSIRGLSRPEREAEILHLNGRSRLIRSYLAHTVLDGQSSRRRDFLLRTSPLGILDGALCDALLGRSGSAATLRELEREQLFTTSSDDGLTYRYHQVLRDHLEVVLEDELPDSETTALYARAARLLEAAGHAAEALRAYKRSGDWGAAARLVRRSADVTDTDATSAGVALVVAEQNDPWLALARVRRQLRHGSIDAALHGLRQVEDSADDPDLVDHCAWERVQTSVWLGSAPPSGSSARSPLTALRALTRSVQVDCVPSSDPAWGLVEALRHVLSGHLSRGRHELERAYPQLAEGSWPQLAAGLLGTVLELGAPGGRHCTATLEDLSLTADVQGYPWLSRLAQGVQAGLMVQTEDQSRRLSACRSAIDACLHDGDRWGELLLRAGTAVAMAGQGEQTEASSQLDLAARIAHDLDAPVLGLWVRALTLVLGDPQAAPDRVLTALARRVEVHDVDLVLATCTVVTHRRETPRAVPRRAATGDAVQCLGGFRLSCGGALDLDPLRPRAQLLLMLLALHHGNDVHRECLIDSLWPDATLAAGTHRLQVAVSSIRRHLEDHGVAPTAVQRHGDAYRLQLPGVTCDVQRLEQAVAEVDQISRAGDPVALADRAATLIQLYRGDLLPEVGAAEWVVHERERLRLGTARALATAALRCLEFGRADLGLRPARRVVELDPLRDSAWLVLARIQQGLGDHSAAQMTLTEHARMCAQLSPAVPARPAARPPPGAARARV